MTQVYHSNAKTNQHQRKIIQQFSCANTELSEQNVLASMLKPSQRIKLETALKIKALDLE